MYSIAIADDDFTICNGLQHLMSNTFADTVNITTFSDGEGLLKYISDHKVDIIISDISMSGKNGIDICKYVNAQCTDTHVILMTGHLEFEYAKDAVNNHVDYFLPKPFSSKQMIECVSKIIDILNKTAKTELENSVLYLKNWSSLRALMQNAYKGQINLLIASQLYENVTHKVLSESKACQVAFTSDKIDQYTTDEIERMCCDLGEFDCEFCSIFFIQADSNTITFLIIYKDYNYDKFFTDFIASFKFATDITLKAEYNLFANFEEWYHLRNITTICENFVNYLYTSNADHASAYLKTTINDYTAQQLLNLYEFINDYLKQKTDFSLIQVNDFNRNADIKSLQHLICSIPYNIQDLKNDNIFIIKAKEYIRKNYSNYDLSLSTVANNLNMSSGHLGKLFKAYTGINFPDYVLMVRMENAKHLLASTNKTVEEISKETGYNYTAYFRKMFNNFVHMSPSQFREASR